MKRLVALIITISLLGCCMTSIGLSKSIDNISTNIITTQNANSEFYTHTYSQRYAMIVVGEYRSDQHYTWFLKATQNLYNVLTSETYGFTDEEVFILLTMKTWQEPEIFNESIVDYEATEENIETVLDTFETGGENEVPSDGLFFFTFIDHGANNVFGLEGDDSVSAAELKSYTENIQGRNIFLLQPCMSGSFVDDMSKPGRIVCASVLPFQVEGGWIETFTRAMSGQVNGDIRPADGRLSLEEAFYQAALHIQDDAPLGKYSVLDDNGDSEGSKPFLLDGKGYNINDFDQDGYRAARVFYLTYEEFPLDAKAKESGEERTVSFEASAYGGIKPYSYHWDFGDGEESTDQNPTHTYEEDGDYEVTLTVTDDNGDTVEKVLSIKIPKSKIKIIDILFQNIFNDYPILQKLLNFL